MRSCRSDSVERHDLRSEDVSTGTYAGVDLGTSGLKVAVVDASGSLVAEAEADYPVRTPRDGWTETDPADWLAAYRRCETDLVRKLDGARPDAVGFAGQMHGVVLTGESGETLRPAVLWPDRRAEEVLGRWRSMDVRSRTRLGNPIVSGMAGPVLSWLREHEARVLDRTALIRSPKDWLRSRLTADTATEPSDASATLLWDVVGKDWSAPACEVAGIVREQLPRLVASESLCGELGWDGANVPAVAGGADTACVLDALRGVRGVDPESLVVNVGSGIQLVRRHDDRAARDDPPTHQYLDTRAHGYEMLAVQNGGRALTWALSVLGVDWDDAVRLAAQSSPGAEGVSFVPFLSGERGHVAAVDARAAWTGMTEHASRAAIVRSCFEGLAFSVRLAREILGDHGPVVLTGGGSRDPFVRQLVADVLDRPADVVGMRSATAIGAAVVAARGLGERIAPRADVARVEPRGGEPLADAYDRWRDACAASAP